MIVTDQPLPAMACGAGPEMIAPGGAPRNPGSLKEIERARGAGERGLN